LPTEVWQSSNQARQYGSSENGWQSRLSPQYRPHGLMVYQPPIDARPKARPAIAQRSMSDQ